MISGLSSRVGVSPVSFVPLLTVSTWPLDMRWGKAIGYQMELVSSTGTTEQTGGNGEDVFSHFDSHPQFFVALKKDWIRAVMRQGLITESLAAYWRMKMRVDVAKSLLTDFMGWTVRKGRSWV